MADDLGVERRAAGRDSPQGTWWTAAFGCAVLTAATLVLAAAVSFAELAAAHHHDGRALVTLSYLVAFCFAWKGVALGAFLLAFGCAASRSGAAPRWFVILTLVLSVPGLVAVGYVVLWLVAPVWFVLAGFKVRAAA